MSQFALNVIILFGIYTVLCLSLDLLLGGVGQLSLGHAGFFAVGAYTAGVVAGGSGARFWLGALLGMVLGAVAGTIFALPALRLSSDYLALATLAGAEIIRNVANVSSITGGAFGLSSSPPELFGFSFTNKNAYLALVWSIALGFAVFWLIVRRRRPGLMLAAIREDELAAASLGYRTGRAKVLSFAASAALAALAGSLYMGYFLYVDSRVFSVILSINVLVIVVLGGVGNVFGVILGAAVFVLLPEILQEFQSWRDITYGLALLLLMLLRPRGLWPERRPRSPARERESVGGRQSFFDKPTTTEG